MYILVRFLRFPSQVRTFWAIGQYTARWILQATSTFWLVLCSLISWRQSFAKLLIPKLSLHNSAAFCLRKKPRRDLPENLTFYSSIYTLASLNYTLSVSEYATTNVTAKPFTFLRKTNNGYTVVSHTWTNKQIMVVLWSLTLSLLKENNFSDSIPHRVKCRTKAVNHLSLSLETWKMLKFILSKLKFLN